MNEFKDTFFLSEAKATYSSDVRDSISEEEKEIVNVFDSQLNKLLLCNGKGIIETLIAGFNKHLDYYPVLKYYGQIITGYTIQGLLQLYLSPSVRFLPKEVLRIMVNLSFEAPDFNQLFVETGAINLIMNKYVPKDVSELELWFKLNFNISSSHSNYYEDYEVLKIANYVLNKSLLVQNGSSLCLVNFFRFYNLCSVFYLLLSTIKKAFRIENNSMHQNLLWCIYYCLIRDPFSLESEIADIVRFLFNLLVLKKDSKTSRIIFYIFSLLLINEIFQTILEEILVSDMHQFLFINIKTTIACLQFMTNCLVASDMFYRKFINSNTHNIILCLFNEGPVQLKIECSCFWIALFYACSPGEITEFINEEIIESFFFLLESENSFHIVQILKIIKYLYDIKSIELNSDRLLLIENLRYHIIPEVSNLIEIIMNSL